MVLTPGGGVQYILDLLKDDTKSIFLPDKTANHMENPIEGNRKEEKRDKRVARIKNRGRENGKRETEELDLDMIN